MIMATMKRRVDRLLSSQTAVGGRRPGAVGGPKEKQSLNDIAQRSAKPSDVAEG